MAVPGHVHAVDDAGDVARRGAHHLGEVADVLLDREVHVHRGRLRGIADAPAQVRRAGGAPEHGQAARPDRLRTHDRAHERGLAASARPEETGDRAGRDGEVEPVQDVVATPCHLERPALDGRISHVVN